MAVVVRLSVVAACNGAESKSLDLRELRSCQKEDNAFCVKDGAAYTQSAFAYYARKMIGP